MRQNLPNPVEDGLVEGFEAFATAINIPLFNDICAFIEKTTAADTTVVIRELRENHLWYSQSMNEGIQELYGFRYLGELLERFEERASSDIRDIRAIALAMAYTKDLLTVDMFVGNQKNVFIRKVKALASGDIYLTGALYLLDKDTIGGQALLDALSQAKHQRTEELIFVMSLYDDFAQAFGTYKPQLLDLLGASRSMPVIGNMGILSWLIGRLHSIIKQHRTKDMALFRALVALPTSFVKSGDKHHGFLLANGYTPDEIIYANALALLYRPIRDTINAHSIVAEKIVMEMCRTFINSEATHSQGTYAYLAWLLVAYNSFEIKYKGYKGITDAIKQDIRLTNPQTFIWLYRINRTLDVFHFDILTEKWDVLARELDSEAYRALFDKHLTSHLDDKAEQINRRISKYDSLTGLSYLASFDIEFSYDRTEAFSLLVEKGFVKLIDSFTSRNGHETKNESAKTLPIIEYIAYYIKGIHSKEAFDFFKFLIDQYGIGGLNETLRFESYRSNAISFIDWFYHGPSTSYGDKSARFDVKRSFLSDDEHKELVGWLGACVYRYSPDKYVGFVTLMLLDPFIRSLYTTLELRHAYDMIRNLDDETVKQYSGSLRSMFLSEDEQQAEREAEAARKAERERLAVLERAKEMRAEFEKETDGSFHSMLKYLDYHKYTFRGRDEAMVIAHEHLNAFLKAKAFVMGADETGNFAEVCGQLIKAGVLSIAEFREHLSSVKEEG